MDTPEKPDVERSARLAFLVTGAFSLMLGPPALCAGAFTGPHLLIPALGMTAAGSASIAVGIGIANGSPAARVAGIVLAALLAAVTAVAVVSILADERETWTTRVLVALMFAAFAAPVTAAGVTLLRGELKSRAAGR